MTCTQTASCYLIHEVVDRVTIGEEAINPANAFGNRELFVLSEQQVLEELVELHPAVRLKDATDRPRDGKQDGRLLIKSSKTSLKNCDVM